METRIKKNTMDNRNTVFNNDGDVVNGDKIVHFTYNNYQSDEETYLILTKKNNYTEFYKRYISNFQELKNYAVDSIFPCASSKKYEFTSDKLIFGKKVIDWIFGLDVFPEKEIQKFYDSLKEDFELDNDSILVKRWAANANYFKSDFDNSNKAYSELYDEIVDRKEIPTWYIDDVSIDGRNILIQSKERKKLFKSKYYLRLSSLKHKLSYPDIDRVKVEIYENVQKTVFNNKNKGKYTTYYGIGLEECFSQIQDLVYMTVFYGSITHLKFIRQLIANVMFMYAETFNDKDFYELTLKMLYLSGEFKRYVHLYEKILLKQRFINSEKFIHDLLNSSNSLFKFEKEKHEIFIFKIYGYYLNNKEFADFEDKIIELLNSEFSDNNTKVLCLEAIGKNMNRISKINEIMDYIISCFVNGYSLYYVYFGNIINSIEIGNLDEIEMEKIDSIIEYSLKNKERINYDISHCIVDFKKHNPNVTKYDELINSDHEKTGLIYKIENDESDLEIIKEIVKILKERHEENEENPGITTEYRDNYRIGTNIFEKEKFNDDVKLYFEDEFIPFAEDILLSKNETIYEKIKIIKLFIHMLKKEYSPEIKKRIMTLIEDCGKADYKNEYRFSSFNEKDEEDLKINIMISKVISGDVLFKDFLCKSLELILIDESNLEEILLCILNIESYIELKEDVINYLYIILKCGFDSDDYDIKNLSVQLLNNLLNTIKKDEIHDLLLSDCPEISLREFKGYYQLLQKVDDEAKKELKDIVDEFKKHKNFFIKRIAVRDL